MEVIILARTVTLPPKKIMGPQIFDNDMLEKFHTKKIIKSHRMFFVCFLFFAYSLGVSVAIQCYIVPQIFPQFDHGDGIITMDGGGFNQIAKAKAEEIREKGWSAWEFRPKEQSPAGIASIFYALLIPKPYVLLPYNALIHALSGCLVLWLLLFVFSWKPALFGSILFVINPAALQWVAQIHRDGVFILGNLLVLVCLVQFWGGLKSSNMRTMAWGFIWGMAGTLLAWAARPYFVQILFIFVLLGLMFITLSCWTTRAAQNVMKCHIFVLALLTFCLLLFQGWLVKYHTYQLLELPTVSAEAIREVAEATREVAEATREVADPLPMSGEKRVVRTKKWIRTEWLPLLVEQKLYHLSVSRRGAIQTGGNTVVDGDVPLNSAPAFVLYFPRALQIGLLSPFPELWRGEGSTPAMTLARKVMGVTTLFFYFCLLGALFGIVSNRKNQVAGLIFVFCFLGILVFTYTYPNVGTLLRFRYGFYMLLIAFGAANIAEMLLRWQKKRQTKKFDFHSLSN